MLLVLWLISVVFVDVACIVLISVMFVDVACIVVTSVVFVDVAFIKILLYGYTVLSNDTKYYSAIYLLFV